MHVETDGQESRFWSCARDERSTSWSPMSDSDTALQQDRTGQHLKSKYLKCLFCVFEIFFLWFMIANRFDFEDILLWFQRIIIDFAYSKSGRRSPGAMMVNAFLTLSRCVMHGSTQRLRWTCRHKASPTGICPRVIKTKFGTNWQRSEILEIRNPVLSAGSDGTKTVGTKRPRPRPWKYCLETVTRRDSVSWLPYHWWLITKFFSAWFLRTYKRLQCLIMPTKSITGLIMGWNRCPSVLIKLDVFSKIQK